jgi:hypothetical protein
MSQPIDYTMRYQIRSGRVNFADYVKRRQLVQDGALLGLNLYPPDHDASIVPIIKEGADFTTQAEYDSYIAEVRQEESSATISVSSASVPNPPTSLVGTSVNDGISISFTPGSDGGSPITNYEYYPVDLSGASWTLLSPAQTTSPLIIPEFPPGGATYDYKLRAVNAIGVSADSATVSVAIPSAPNPPTLVYILPGDGNAYVYFTPGSGTITNYEYTMDSGATYTAISPADSISPVLIPGLPNGSLATIGLRAKNGGGTSGISNELTVTPNATAVPSDWLMYDPANASSYPGSNSTVYNVGSYGTLDGTKQDSVTYVDGTGLSPARKVFDFSGSGSRIVFGALDFGSTFTISAWVYPNTKGSINGILANTVANVNTQGFKVAWNTWSGATPPTSDNRMMLEAGGPGPVWGTPASAVNTVVMNEWQYLTYAFDKTNQRIIFYRNGVPVDTADISTVAGVVTSTGSFNIGSYVGGSYAMDAQLGFLKVFNSVLNAGQVLADFNATKATFGL